MIGVGIIAILALCAFIAPVAPTFIDAAPFSSHTLTDGGSYTFKPITMVPQAPGPWVRSTNGSHPALPGQWVQWMGEGPYGWTDTILLVNAKGGLNTTRHSDPTYLLDAPWFDRGTNTWRPGYVRVWKTPPVGVWNNEVWPRAVLSVTTDRSTVVIDVTGAPSEVEVHGDYNDIYLTADLGPQSRLMIDRAALRLFGNHNRVHGWIRTEMTAVRVYGEYNLLDGMSVEGLEVGNDVGLVVFGRNTQGNSARNVFAMCRARKYPASWVHTAFYLDDNTPNQTIEDCWASGFQSGVFVHGGNGNRVTNFVGVDCEVPVVFAPHFSTPTLTPLSIATGVRALGTADADRKVPGIMGKAKARYIYSTEVPEAA